MIERRGTSLILLNSIIRDGRSQFHYKTAVRRSISHLIVISVLVGALTCLVRGPRNTNLSVLLQSSFKGELVSSSFIKKHGGPCSSGQGRIQVLLLVNDFLRGCLKSLGRVRETLRLLISGLLGYTLLSLLRGTSS
jgi:hypothetical protein